MRNETKFDRGVKKFVLYGLAFVLLVFILFVIIGILSFYNGPTN